MLYSLHPSLLNVCEEQVSEAFFSLLILAPPPEKRKASAVMKKGWLVVSGTELVSRLRKGQFFTLQKVVFVVQGGEVGEKGKRVKQFLFNYQKLEN